MNYHELGTTINSGYLQLVEELVSLHFPRDNTAPVALSLPDEAWLKRNRPILQRAFPTVAWEGDGWPVGLCHRLCDEWQRWRDFASSGKGGLRNLNARRRANRWCEDNDVDPKVGLDPGAPWHLPFLCCFVFAADVAEIDGRSYYETLRQLFRCRLEDNVLQRLRDPSWARVWQSVAEWAREQKRGFMLAELPDHLTYVGWPLQHVLLSVSERRKLEHWIDNRRGLNRFTHDDLKQWIEQQRPLSRQLEMTRGSDPRLKLLHAWASGYERTVPIHNELGAGNEPEPDRHPRCELVMELDDDGAKVCIAYLRATESIDLCAFDGFELGGSEPYLRKAGSRHPHDLRMSSDLLRETARITRGRVRWPKAECRYLISDNGEWIEETPSRLEQDSEEDVLVLCARGAEKQFVDGGGTPISGLDSQYTLLRCEARQLIRLPDLPPRLMLEGGVRLLPTSRCDYFGVALPRVRNECPTAQASPADLVAVSADGTLSASETALAAHVPLSVSVEIEAADGAKQQIRGWFPKQCPSALPSDEYPKDLAVRDFPDAGWARRLAFGWTPRRRLLCIYSTSSTSEAVLKERIDRLFGAQPPRYLRYELTDLGHLAFSTSTMYAQQQSATTVCCTDARFEVIARIRGREQCVVARLVGAHDWVRLHGLEAEGMEWVEVEEEIFVRASFSDIRKFADDRKVSVVRCDQVGRPIEEPSVAAEVPGIPWDDGVDGVEVWNPLYPLRTRELHSASLQSLIGSGGTFVLRHQGQFVDSYLRMRWDGRCWQRAPIPGRLAADHYWISVRNGWHRYGMVMHGQAARIPLLYGERSQAMYFLRRLRPPVESRRRLCSLAGGLPTHVERGQVQVDALDRVVGGGVFKGAPYFLKYGGVSKEQAEQLAAALDAEIVSVE